MRARSRPDPTPVRWRRRRIFPAARGAAPLLLAATLLATAILATVIPPSARAEDPPPDPLPDLQTQPDPIAQPDPFPPAIPPAIPPGTPETGLPNRLPDGSLEPASPALPEPPGAGARGPDGTVSVLASDPSPPPAIAPVTERGTPPLAPPFSTPPAGPPGARTTPSAPLAASPSAPPSVPASRAPAASPSAADLAARGLAFPFPPLDAADTSPPRPLTLLEALERSGDRSRRLWITQAYWKLAAAAARFRHALEAEERLAVVAPGGNAEDGTILETAEEAARGRTAAAAVELVAAQQELADLVRLPVPEPPPIPADRPLTSAYQTHFETIFAVRPATGRVRAIHRQLPPAHAAILARSRAVTSAEARFTAVETLHAQGKKPIGAVLAAHDAILEQQLAFVDAVAVYNLAIAEYVMAVADLSVPDAAFATMLIGQPLPWRPQPGSPPVEGILPVSGQVPPQAPQQVLQQAPPLALPQAPPPGGGLAPRLFPQAPEAAPSRLPTAAPTVQPFSPGLSPPPSGG